MERLWILVTGLIAVFIGLRGFYKAARPADPIEREKYRRLIPFGVLSVGGGAALTAYALLA